MTMNTERFDLLAALRMTGHRIGNDAADEIEKLSALIDGWRAGHTLCREIIIGLTAERDRLRAIVSDLAALPRAYASAPIDALICRARVATVDAPGEPA